eukprot:5617591-Pleurochrysis_carterae.AAC.1
MDQLRSTADAITGCETTRCTIMARTRRCLPQLVHQFACGMILALASTSGLVKLPLSHACIVVGVPLVHGPNDARLNVGAVDSNVAKAYAPDDGDEAIIQRELHRRTQSNRMQHKYTPNARLGRAGRRGYLGTVVIDIQELGTQSIAGGVDLLGSAAFFQGAGNFSLISPKSNIRS